ncbi:MAG TPA: hypothetical protein VG889_15070 [Rhizomicrobium sp.]|nr:hypothetical protein [Rhizomicrobium sp.]
MLRLTFGGPLAYVGNKGYRTAEISLPFKALEDLRTPKKGMVDLDGATSNQIFEIFEEWNKVLESLPDIAYNAQDIHV